MKTFLLIFLFLIFSQNLFAFSPENHLPDEQEQRAREIFLQIKCPVCAGQVIESSDTEISYELRKLIREQIREGKSDEEIKSYLQEKFGEDIVISPSFNPKTFLLWLLPMIFVSIGAVFIFKKFRS